MNIIQNFLAYLVGLINSNFLTYIELTRSLTILYKSAFKVRDSMLKLYSFIHNYYNYCNSKKLKPNFIPKILSFTASNSLYLLLLL